MSEKRMVSSYWLADEFSVGRYHVVLNPDGSRASWSKMVPRTTYVETSTGQHASGADYSESWLLVEDELWVAADWLKTEFADGRYHVVLNPDGGRASWGGAAKNTTMMRRSNGKPAIFDTGQPGYIREYPSHFPSVWKLVEEVPTSTCYRRQYSPRLYNTVEGPQPSALTGPENLPQLEDQPIDELTSAHTQIEKMKNDLVATIVIIQQLLDTPTSTVAFFAAESAVESLVSEYHLEESVKGWW